MKKPAFLMTLSFPQLVLYTSIAVIGLFHEYLSCAVSIILLVWLVVCMCRRRTLCLQFGLISGTVALLSISYLVTAFWAIDGGEAILGFFKYLPLPLYLLVLMQYKNGSQSVVDGIPYAVTTIAVVSIIGSYIPACSSFFVVAGRLAGTMQYPNTFAIVLLVAELLLISKDALYLRDYGCIAVLCFGLLYTGSRTVFILAILSNVVTLLFNKKKVVRVGMLCCLGAALLLVGGYCLVTGNTQLITRFFSISLSESTFVGRLLYTYDMLPVILRHPFGLGYMGYYYIQSGVQTGVYSVMYMHNDILQLVLDVGWIPSLAFFVAVIRSVFIKTFPIRYKIILVTMLMHACFDFDLQYLSVFMMFLLFTEQTPVKSWEIKSNHALSVVVAGVLVIANLYVGSAQLLFRLGKHEAVDAIYPFHTRNDMELLKKATTIDEMNARADRILQRNDHIALAYSAKARVAFSKGDFEQVIAYKNRALELARYDNEEYEEYAVMLIQGISLYQQAGDGQSAEICAAELLHIPRKMRAAMNAQSNLGKRINQQPHLALSEEVQQYIDSIR